MFRKFSTYVSDPNNSMTCNAVNTQLPFQVAQSVSFLPIYSIAGGLVDLARHYEKKDCAALLSGIASLFYSS